MASQRDASGGVLPVRTAVNKENVKDAGVWSKAKASQRTTPVVPVEDLNKYQKPAFSCEPKFSSLCCREVESVLFSAKICTHGHVDLIFII